ncbi:gp15 [Mycobacterium phage Barnyard]|uniref:Uncharacterized protein n=1 Tax=Mycobacterium phage Barnyard TaxID=205880 RepID=Q856F7_9CAUD|nr:gp15 [Mycobacterium phage Barnyard]AAN02069.1 hypothetical protein PBI_BARNYARD_15 [Mycobacterium phage Barnyard]
MMARSHKMTPARKAALRKAQLVSARKRRRRTVKNEVKRAGRQTLSAARAGGSVATRKAVKRFNSPANRARRRKALKVAAVGAGVGTAAVLGAKAAPMGRQLYASRNVSRGPRRVSSSRQPLRTPRAVTGTRTRALTMGPKGKSTMRSRRYRERKRQERVRRVVGSEMHKKGLRTASEIRASRNRKYFDSVLGTGTYTL